MPSEEPVPGRLLARRMNRRLQQRMIVIVTLIIRRLRFCCARQILTSAYTHGEGRQHRAAFAQLYRRSCCAPNITRRKPGSHVEFGAEVLTTASEARVFRLAASREWQTDESERCNFAVASPHRARTGKSHRATKFSTV